MAPLLRGSWTEIPARGVEAGGTGKRDSVVGEGSGPEGRPAARLSVRFCRSPLRQNIRFAVAGHAVGDPCIVQSLRAGFRSPPLMGEGVGEEADAGFVADAG